jgi:hypothetical protein
MSMLSPQPRPLALSDSQLDAVLRAAAPLQPVDRDAFLVLVAARLRGVGMIGDGVVARVCKEAQREFWDAPDLSRSRDVSKWR